MSKEPVNIGAMLAESITFRRNSLDKVQAIYDTYRQDFLDVVNPLADVITDVSMDYDSFTLNVTGDYETLKRVMKTLADSGFHRKGPPMDEKQTNWFSYFNREEDERTYTIWLSFASSMCRRVLVGKKWEQVDVYDVVCGEDLPPT